MVINAVICSILIAVILSGKSWEIKSLNEMLWDKFLELAQKSEEIRILEKQIRTTPIIWVIDKYTEEEIEELKSYERSLVLIVKILTYNAAISTDKIRMPLENNENREEVIWRANNAHENLFFFWKLLNQAIEDRSKKSWQNIE